MPSQTSAVIRFFSFVTLVTFFPSCVAVWNFVPERLMAAEAAEMPTTETTANTQAGASRPMLQQLTKSELSSATGGPIQLARRSDGANAVDGNSRLASAASVLPTVEALLASIPKPGEEKKLPSVKVAQLPGGPSEAVAALNEADGLRNSGQLVDAIIAYFEIMDTYPLTAEAASADGGMNAIIKELGEGQARRAESEAIESYLSTWQPNTVEGLYGALTYYGERSSNARKAGVIEQAEYYSILALDSARSIMGRDFNHYLQQSVTEYFYTSAIAYPISQSAVLMEELRDYAEAAPASLARFGAFYACARYAGKDLHNEGLRELNCANALTALEPVQDELNALMSDQYVPAWVKAYLGFAVGYSHRVLGHLDQAVETMESVIQLVPGQSKSKVQLAYELAYATSLRQWNDPNAQVSTWSDYVDTYPSSRFAPQAMLKLAGVYLANGQYPDSADILRELLNRYPESQAARTAEIDLNYVMTNVYDSVQVAAAAPMDQRDPQLAQLCGPRALHALLDSRNIASTVDELARLAGTDATGTTMLALITAARAKGVDLVGVAANSVHELSLPAIAYVNNNHFLLVTEATADGVVLVDGKKGERVVTLQEFSGMWDGKALVQRTESQRGELKVAVLSETKGGGGDDEETGDSETCDKDKKCDCQNGGAGNGGGPFGGGQGEGEGGGWLDQMATSQQSPTALSGLTSPGIGLRIQTYRTGLDMNVTDLNVGVRGPLKLSLERKYVNRRGFHRGETQGTTNPWNNNIGDGWSHNLNMHLLISSGATPTTVTAYDELGNAQVFSYIGTFWGGNWYGNSDEETSERGEFIARDNTTLQYGWFKPGGVSYGFSAATTDANRFARLESIGDASGNSISLSYDGAVGTGKLTKASSPSGDGQHLKLSYAGNLITKVELKSDSTVLQTTSYAYSASNELTKVSDNDSKTVQYEYASDAGISTSRMISKITDKASNVATIAWTFGDNVYDETYEAYKIDLTNANGLKSTYDRSFSSHACTSTNWDGSTLLSKFSTTPVTGDAIRSKYKDFYTGVSTYERWTYEYDGSKDLTRTLRPDNSAHRTLTWTSNGRISTTTNNTGQTQTYYYPSGGLYATKVRDTAGLDTYYYYDASNRLTKAVTPSSGANGFVLTYDGYGDVISKTTPMGQIWTMAYDSKGQLTSSKDPLNNETKYEYDLSGNVTKTTDPRNKTIYYYYATSGCGGCGGSGGQLTKVKDALNNETTFAYDGNGSRTKVTDALSRATDYFYDAMGRLTKVESLSGSGNVATTAYDLVGRVTTQTDFEGKTKNLYYTFRGELTKQSDGVGTSIEYTHDSAGILSTVKDGAGNTTDYDYDGSNRLTKVNYADGKVTKYFYDSAGRQTKVGAGASGTTDPTEYFFNATTGLMTKTRFTASGGTSDAVYAYDNNGQLTKLTDWIDNTDGLRYAYDAAGRLTTLTDYDDSTLTYTYDAAGNVSTMTDYHGSVVSYAYTDRNEVSTITAPGSKVWDYDYNAIGQPTKCSIPNGMTTEYAYDGRNRMTKIEHKDGSTVLDGFTYSLTSGGNITKTTHQDNSYWDYWYDQRDRLTKAERKTSGNSLLKRWTYTYSLADNMMTKETYDGSTTESYTYYFTSGNELTKQTVSGTDTDFAYDAWGRTTSKTSGGSTATYYWNYGDKLTKASSNFGGEGTVEYDYGGDQKRRERVSSSGTTWYNYDVGWNLLNEEDGSNSVSTTYVHDPASPIGTVLADLAGATPASGTARYYSRDNIGSTRRLRNASKGSLGLYEYEPYGADYSVSGASITDKFTGHDWDDTSDLYYAPHRYYAPSLAKWMSRDPLDRFDIPNLYQYANCSPTHLVDPRGESAVLVIGGLITIWALICLARAKNIADNEAGHSHNNLRAHCVMGCETVKCFPIGTSLFPAFANDVWEVVTSLFDTGSLWGGDSFDDSYAAWEGGILGQEACASESCADKCKKLYPN